MDFDPKINPKSLLFEPFIVAPGSNVNTLPNELNDLLQTLSDKRPDCKVNLGYYDNKVALIERTKIADNVGGNKSEYLVVTFPKNQFEVISEEKFHFWFSENFPGFDPPDSVPYYQPDIDSDFIYLKESSLSAAVVDEELQATRRAQAEADSLRARILLLEAKLRAKESEPSVGISSLNPDNLAEQARISVSKSDNELPVELDDLIKKLPDKLRARDDANSLITYEVKLIKLIGNIGLVEAVPTVNDFKDEDESKYLAVSCHGNQDSNKFKAWFCETFEAGIPKIVSYDTPEIEMHFQKLQPILEDVCGQLAGRITVLNREIDNLRKKGASETAGNRVLITDLEGRLKDIKVELKKAEARRSIEEIVEIKPRLKFLETFLDVLPKIADIAGDIPELYDNYVDSQKCEGLNKYNLFVSTCSRQERNRFVSAKGALQAKVAQLYNLVQSELIEKKEELILNLILKEEIFGIDTDQILIDIDKRTKDPEEREIAHNQLMKEIETKQVYYCGFSPDFKIPLREIIGAATYMFNASNDLDIEGKLSLADEFDTFHRDGSDVKRILRSINEPILLDSFMMPRVKARARIQELQEQIKFLKQEGLI